MKRTCLSILVPVLVFVCGPLGCHAHRAGCGPDCMQMAPAVALAAAMPLIPAPPPPQRSPIGDSPVESSMRARNNVLSHVDFSRCTIADGQIRERAHNYLVRSQARDSQEPGACVFGIGGAQRLYGKLIPPAFRPARDVWMSGYVYFPPEFAVPQSSVRQGVACDMGAHLWRLYSSLSSSNLSMDLNIPAGSSSLQLFVIDGRNRREFVKNTGFKPAADSRRGRWQHWQVHFAAGTPGGHDGFLRFYADGKLIDSLERQDFLPADADQSWLIRYADLQSNVNDGSCHLWPEQNGWYIHDMWVCTDAGCS